MPVATQFFHLTYVATRVFWLHTIHLLESLNAVPFHIHIFLLDEDKPDYYEIIGMTQIDVI
jgi:hypothetical protein